MEEELHGFWKVKSHLLPDEDEIVVISSSRFVHFPLVSEGPPPKQIAVRLWCDQIGDKEFLVSLDPKKEGWKISIWLDQRNLIIHNGTREFRCLRVEEPEVTESTKALLTQAYNKMDAVEAKMEEIEQVGDGDAEEAL